MSKPSAHLVALLGDPVAHSVSPAIHAAAFASSGIAGTYVACRVETEAYPVAANGLYALGATGANVTIPHKRTALQEASEASAEARTIGAANTLVRTETGWRAENTDVAGFIAGLGDDSFSSQPVVVLGAGGAARAVVYALARHVRPSLITVAARRADQARQLAAEASAWGGGVVGVAIRDAPVQKARLVINATPIGMANATETPWPDAEDFHLEQTVYDLVYRPAQTRLLTDAAARGAHIIGGLPMLIAQAAASFQLWTGCPMDVPAATRAARHALGLNP